MQEVIHKWLFDPMMGKAVAAVIGLTVIYALVRLLQRSIGRYVPDSDARYRARKIAGLLGYVTAFGLLGAVPCRSHSQSPSAWPERASPSPSRK
jgi:hypothetical protein